MSDERYQGWPGEPGAWEYDPVTGQPRPVAGPGPYAGPGQQPGHQSPYDAGHGTPGPAHPSGDHPSGAYPLGDQASGYGPSGPIAYGGTPYGAGPGGGTGGYGAAGGYGDGYAGDGYAGDGYGGAGAGAGGAQAPYGQPPAGSPGHDPAAYDPWYPQGGPAPAGDTAPGTAYGAPGGAAYPEAPQTAPRSATAAAPAWDAAPPVTDPASVPQARSAAGPSAPGGWGPPRRRPPGDDAPGGGRPEREGVRGRGPQAAGSGRGYRSDEFSFVDDEAEQTEDVVDWLTFAETRSERRDERRRAMRTRLIGLAVVLAVVAAAGGGWFAWQATRDDGKAAAAPATRGAVLIQLRANDGKAAASAILADDPGRGGSAMLTVPSATVVAAQATGAQPIGEVLLSEGAGASRDALVGLLGVPVDGSWVISAPVLEGLVSMVGGIQLEANAEVRAPDGKVLVPPGRSLVGGAGAVAYALLKPPGEDPSRGAERFGQVLVATLRALPADQAQVATILRNLANVADPSLGDDRLAALLVQLATAVQGDRMRQGNLPLRPDGGLDTAAAGPVVKDLMGGVVKETKVTGPARVAVEDATGRPDGKPLENARVKLLNGGYTYVPGGQAQQRARQASLVQYTSEEARETAVQVALTLGLNRSVVQKAATPLVADVVVTLGQDFRWEPPKT